MNAEDRETLDWARDLRSRICGQGHIHYDYGGALNCDIRTGREKAEIRREVEAQYRARHPIE